MVSPFSSVMVGGSSARLKAWIFMTTMPHGRMVATLKIFIDGENNMNEEWFGICAKGQTTPRGLYSLYPRAAYYALKEVHSLNPYLNGVTLQSVEDHFAGIQLMDAVIKARGDQAALVGEQTAKLRVSELRAEFTTYNTGGKYSLPLPISPIQIMLPIQINWVLITWNLTFLVLRPNPPLMYEPMLFSTFWEMLL
ncbi:MAG: hypothetical protein U5K54_09240 [Cytophagales bacterium]|nr:hypothetical protein [Cytophagales bacterium]